MSEASKLKRAPVITVLDTVEELQVALTALEEAIQQASAIELWRGNPYERAKAQGNLFALITAKAVVKDALQAAKLQEPVAQQDFPTAEENARAVEPPPKVIPKFPRKGSFRQKVSEERSEQE